MQTSSISSRLSNVHGRNCSRSHRHGLGPVVLLFAVSLTLAVAAGAICKAQQWKPAKAPLMTPWGEKVSSENVHQEYPRPQMVREDWLSLNGVWQLAFAEAGEEPPIGKQLPQRILVPFPVESALSGVGKHSDRLWYRRTFRVPQQWQGKRVLLHFQAVDWEATVYVNDKQVGTHRGGYDAFTFDITDALKPGAEQELVVGVYDPTNRGDQPRGKQVLEPKGIWYTPTTGIWQTVWLEGVPSTYIKDLWIVPDVDGRRVRVRATVEANTGSILVAVRVPLENGRTLTATGKPGQFVDVVFPADYKIKLWSPESPHLYNMTVALTAGDKVVDQVQSYFGMRKVHLGKDDRGRLRICLNGKPVFMVGPLDQGFWPDGLYTAPSDEALKFDIEMTKKLGFNATRKHVKIEPQRWYYWCDKLGLLVWQDMPNGNNRSPDSHKQFEEELRQMVLEHRNHPSIIMWVVFNEGWGQHDTPRYVELVRKWDPTRLVNEASGWHDRGSGDVHDIHRYPGPASPEPEPNRAIVLGEFGGLGLVVPGHTWAGEGWGYRGMRDAQELTRRYVGLLRRVYELQEQYGLSGAIYTQITDVERECNGLMTYDRRVVKPDVEAIAAANRGIVPRLRILVPTARQQAAIWRYTFREPKGAWYLPDYDDSDWQKGPAGFGRKDTPGSVVRTEWTGSDIWLRRQFELPEVDPQQLVLIVHHDEAAEIYINGKLAAKLEKFTTEYIETAISAEALATIKPGKNVMAVHCHQTTGGQYIDVGIGVLEPPQQQQ